MNENKALKAIAVIDDSVFMSHTDKIIRFLLDQLNIKGEDDLKHKWHCFEDEFRFFEIQNGLFCPSYEYVALILMITKGKILWD